MIDRLAELLGAEDARSLIEHRCEGIPQERIHAPGPQHLDSVFAHSNRSNRVLRNLQALHDHGRLAGTGYLSILPVDQGIEHTAAASFAPNPDYFDPENIVKLAIEAGCNGVASTLGVLGIVSGSSSVPPMVTRSGLTRPSRVGPRELVGVTSRSLARDPKEMVSFAVARPLIVPYPSATYWGSSGTRLSPERTKMSQCATLGTMLASLPAASADVTGTVRVTSSNAWEYEP